jgi:hypothetical protein
MFSILSVHWANELKQMRYDFLIFLNSHREGGWSPNWVHSACRPLISLFHLPRVIVSLENLVEWRLAGEPKVLGENLP